MKLTVKIIGVFVLFCCLSTVQAFAASIASVSNVSVHADKHQTQIEIQLDSTPNIKVFTLKGTPPRIVIDIEATTLTRPHEGGVYTGAGNVTKLRYAIRGNDLRFVADLNGTAKYTSHVLDNGVLRVWIEGGNSDKKAKKTITKKTVATKPSFRRFSGVAYPRLKPELQQAVSPKLVTTSTKTKPAKHKPTSLSKPKISKPTLRIFTGLPVPMLKPKHTRRVAYRPMIVIDPGHGGRDPGAIGGAKVKEETVTLKAALELRKQLLKTGKYRVVLTRTTDTYVVHEKRVRIARKAGADLFISLHADSLDRPEIRGASVYTLADRAKKRGHNLVNTQNWIHDVDLASHSGAVGDILVNLAQREALSKSSQFADILIPQLKKRTVLLGNTHRQASIYVLIAPDVPAVLLEMGFISNLKDEKLLNSAKHRAKLMKSVTEATNLYFKAQTALQ